MLSVSATQTTVNENQYFSVDWEQKYSGVDEELIWSVTKTIDGNYLLIGDSWSSTDVDPLIMKIDSTGKQIWIFRLISELLAYPVPGPYHDLRRVPCLLRL